MLTSLFGAAFLAAQGGDLNALKLEVLNAELLSSITIGAQVLIGLRPNGQDLTVDQVRTLFLHVAAYYKLQCRAASWRMMRPVMTTTLQVSLMGSGLSHNSPMHECAQCGM